MSLNEIGLIKLSEDQEAAINRLASMLTLPRDIARIIEVDEDLFCEKIKEKGSEIYRAFYSGYLKTEISIREKTFATDAKDIEEADFLMRQLNDYKSKLTIELNA